MNKQSDRYRILVDVACQDQRGLSGIKDLAMVKSVVEDIAPKEKIRWLLVRIHHSRYPSELVAFLVDVYGNTHRELEPVIQAFTKVPANIFEQNDRDVIADTYWSSVVRERIVRGDFRRAYDEIRHAFRGFRPIPFTPMELLDVPYRHAPDMGASFRCIEVLVNDLYAAMLKKGLFTEIVADERVSVRIDGLVSRPPGIVFAVATGGCDGYDHAWKFTSSGRQILKIAAHLSEKRNKTRQRRVAQKTSV